MKISVRILTITMISMMVEGCNPPVNPMEKQIVQICLDEGYAYHSDNFNACWQEQWNTIDKAQNENAQNAFKQAQREQKKADEAQCKDYGFKKGTQDFANCMMKLD